MIDINLCMEILELKDKFADFDVGLTNDEIEKRMEAHMDDIFNLFLDKEKVPLRCSQCLPHIDSLLTSHAHTHHRSTAHTHTWCSIRVLQNLLRENVIPEKPEAKDTFEGRLVNPGHTIEVPDRPLLHPRPNFYLNLFVGASPMREFPSNNNTNNTNNAVHVVLDECRTQEGTHGPHRKGTAPALASKRHRLASTHSF